MPPASALDRVRSRIREGTRVHDPRLAENLWLTFEALRLAGRIDDDEYPHVLRCTGHLAPFLEAVRDAPGDLVRVIRDVYPTVVTPAVFRQAQRDYATAVGLRKQAALYVIRASCVRSQYRVDRDVATLDFNGTDVPLTDFIDVFRMSAALSHASLCDDDGSGYAPDGRMDQYVVVTDLGVTRQTLNA